MKRPRAGGGWQALRYVLRASRRTGGVLRMWRALRAKNACKTCALGMGGQLGGMVNEHGRFPEVCKKSIQAMAADMQGAIQPHFFDDFSLEKLRGFSPRELEHAGRLVDPQYAGPLDSHFRAITWEDAFERIANKLAKVEPDEAFFYLSGRSSNEAGFLLHLFARLYGTNNISNCSYYCHQASGVALASVTGSSTATVSLDDIAKCDLIYLIGCNPASNHPRLMAELVRHKRRGGKIIVINPMKELGLVRFRVPSDPRSLLFGSTIADEYVQPHIGGDIALLTGVAKVLLERSALDFSFISARTAGWKAVEASIRALDWEKVVDSSGVAREQIDRVATMYATSRAAIFCWTMGITHHAHGVENVQMIANLALMRGMIGRPGAGLLPLRGHSNVQGMGSIGATPALKQQIFDRLQSHFGAILPTNPGLDTLASLEAADEGRVRFAFHLGGNLYGSNPDSTFAARSLSKIDMTVFLSTALNTGHICGHGRESIILPVLARDEEEQSTTQESMFSYVRLSEGGSRRHDGPRSEVEAIAEIAERVFRARGAASPIDWSMMRAHRHIRHAIAHIIPGYEAIGEIDATKTEFHIPGRVLREPRFATASGRAKFHVVPIPSPLAPGSAGGSASNEDAAHLDPPPEAGANGNVSSHSLRLMTIRSEGQFNTVVYEDEDIYRGQERRDVIMMARVDIERLDLHIDDRITVRSEAGALCHVLVREGDIRAGNCAMYYPEANALVARIADPQSRTPSFKSTRVWIERDNGEDGGGGASVDPAAITQSGGLVAANGPAKRTLRTC